MKGERTKSDTRKNPSVTDQYRAVSVEITAGHESDLTKVPVPTYSSEQHETWALMVDRQSKALPGRATREYLDALKFLDLPRNKIPRLIDVSKKLESASGWRITRTAGLVPEKEFFECLSQKLFPCTDFIRERGELEYTPSPDMFHDLFGHIPLITVPTFAEFYEFFGKAAMKASGDKLTKLQRIYWFSVEFGLIRKPEGLRIYGSGILSSPGEVFNSLGPDVKTHPWNFKMVENQYFEIHHMQGDLFVIDSFESLLKGFKDYCQKSRLL
jgi:phenylalanine-4-hydroxylase